MKPNKKTVSRSGLLKINNSSGQFMLSFGIIIIIFLFAGIAITVIATDYAQDVICNLPEWEGKVGGSPPEFVGTTGPDAYNDTIYVGWRISKMIEAAIGFPFEWTREGITQGIVERVVEIAQSQRSGDPTIRQLGDDTDPASGSKNWPWIPNNSVYVISCTKRGDRWSFHNLAYRQCAPGEIPEAGQEGESLLVCRPETPNPPGKYYSCESNVCAEKDCPVDGTPCPGNDSSCFVDNIGSPCGAIIPPVNCVATCSGNAWDIPCGQTVITNSQADIDACAGQDPPVILGCPGGNIGYKCDNPKYYCDFDEGACKPIDSALCDTNPSATVREDRFAPVTDGNTNCGSTNQGKWGIQCPGGEGCDIEEGTNTDSRCFDIAQTALNPKQLFDVTAGESLGIGINFNAVSNADYRYPQLCVPANSIYCPSCGLNADGSSQIVNKGLFLNYDRLKSKDSSLRFSMVSRGLGGKNNYALLQYNDVQKEDTNHKKVHSERFIVQVDSPQTGECLVESREFTGETGADSQTKIKYVWDFDQVDESFCEITLDPSHVAHVCDGTQFMISLLQRLNAIKGLFEASQPTEALALTDFNLLLMPDSYNSDFRNDFDAYYSQSDLFSPSWYNDGNGNGFTQFVTGDFNNHLEFLPETIASPGKYRVVISFSVANPSDPFDFFDSDHNPDVNIMIGFIPMQTPEGLNLDNALYYLPLDGFVGIGPSGGSFPGPSRNGYGVSITGTPISIDSSQTTATVTGNTRSTMISQLNSFDATNTVQNRGRVLQIVVNTDGTRQVIFSPVVATPVAMKIPSTGELEEKGTYYLRTATSGPYENTDNPSFAGWTGWASKKTDASDPYCSNFEDRALPLMMDDLYASGDPNGHRSLSFSNSRQETDKFLVFGTVFYTPKTQGLVLSHTADNNTVLISPNTKLTKTSTGNAELNFTEDARLVRPGYLPNGLKIDSLQELINLANNTAGALCVYTNQDSQGTIETVFFWNRGKLLEELSDKTQTPFSSPANPNLQDIKRSLNVTSTNWFC